MRRNIKLLKNNNHRDWEDEEWIDEFYRFLQGEIPDGISLAKDHKVALTQKQAFSVIWYLQEHFSLLPDDIERCDVCGQLYNSGSQGHYSDLTCKHYCNESCEPPRLFEREQRWEKRKDAPFQKWLKQVKKEQKHYPALKGKEISEPTLRGYFHQGKSPIDALNDILTLV